MAKKLNLLVDTDILIDFFNHRLFRNFFESDEFQPYYSVVTKKELLSKEGIGESESAAIRRFLKTLRIVPLDRSILKTYSELRRRHPAAGKEDCLIAATAIAKKMPLATRNERHFRIFREIKLLPLAKRVS